jgi:hypothetical protein
MFNHKVKIFSRRGAEEQKGDFFQCRARPALKNAQPAGAGSFASALDLRALRVLRGKKTYSTTKSTMDTLACRSASAGRHEDGFAAIHWCWKSPCSQVAQKCPDARRPQFRGVRRTLKYAATTRDKGNAADGRF